jgi:hypothetical protein
MKRKALGRQPIERAVGSLIHLPIIVGKILTWSFIGPNKYHIFQVLLPFLPTFSCILRTT